MILVYAHNTSKRLTYTLNVLFKYIMGVDYKFTTSLEVFKNASLLKINYSPKNIEGVLQIVPSNLLFEKDIKKQNIEIDWLEGVPFFFKTGSGHMAHDVLASSFWMLTRYEEYLPFTPDIHNRFKAEDSLAFKQGFLKKPVVNLWAKALQEKLLFFVPSLHFPNKKTLFLNTLDIDIAYAYKAKGWMRFYGGFLKSFLKKYTEDMALRLCYLKTNHDPYDAYDFIKKSSKNIKTTYFFLVGDLSKYDANIHHQKKDLKSLIKNLIQEHPVGIHPSYLSNQQPKRVAKEIKRLEKITGKKVAISRQHFLKLSFPDTYENLIQNGIVKDYTMGFASQVGFRAGVCNVYPFYNIKKEAQRSLWIVPFQVMDGTLNQYLKLSPAQAIGEIKGLMSEVVAVNGLFVSLWHNSSLSETTIWKGWRTVYQEMLTLMR